MSDRIEMIQLDMIEPSPGNRRVGGFDQAKLEQLAESIKAVGVQQPAVVRAFTQAEGEPARYQLVAGERRWRASRIAGVETLPCVVRELDDVTALKIQYIENLQRDDIHPLDESDGYAQLIEHAGYTVEVLASEVGKSASYVYQRMKLASLIPEARKLFVEGTITAGHAILIARLGSEQQKEIISEEEGVLFDYDDDVISVRDLDDYIHNQIMLDLSKITWKLADAELVPAVGSCQDCPKRTGYQPALFADVCKTKKDYCTDRGCFANKQAAIVTRKRDELDGQDIIEVADGYIGGKLPGGVVENWKWNECKKSDKGAQRVLVVAGETPGRLTWGIIRKEQRGTRSNDELEYKERMKKEAAKRKAADEKNMIKLQAVLAAAEAAVPLEALRICVERIWCQWGYDDQATVIKAEGWTEKEMHRTNDTGAKRIRTMDEAQLSRMLLWFAMVSEVKTPTYGTPSSKTIDALMKIYGVKAPEASGKKAKKKKEGAK
ncbi:MAG: ParB/RepB/Spo0J family partition protein [Spirochaetes bacterium]|nr:ParB/RepB/Spo0J family partition protein [Spirochaetota bacterium]